MSHQYQMRQDAGLAVTSHLSEGPVSTYLVRWGRVSSPSECMSLEASHSHFQIPCLWKCRLHADLRELTGCFPPVHLRFLGLAFPLQWNPSIRKPVSFPSGLVSERFRFTVKRVLPHPASWKEWAVFGAFVFCLRSHTWGGSHHLSSASDHIAFVWLERGGPLIRVQVHRGH